MDLFTIPAPYLLYLQISLLVLIGLALIIAGYRFLFSPDAVKKWEYEERAQEATLYIEGDHWVCTRAKRNETGGKCGIPAWQITVTRHGGTQYMEFCGPFWSISKNDRVHLRLRTKRDEPASTVLSPYGDVLIPERDDSLPP
jgi:hypothetical protein